MLAKMGWEAGQGLGAEGTGIVTPVETKLRPKNVGIAYKGFKERTEQAKAEARRHVLARSSARLTCVCRRGENVSDDDKPKARKGKAPGQVDRSEVWKKPKKAKIKIEHKTYEEIMRDAGEPAASNGIGVIIDATGAKVRQT